jgi:AcrR family transcriptional regulator
MPPVSAALRRRGDRDAEPAFERLLRAAADLFARDGFAGTSLDAVAAGAGVTKGSLYHHFTGKADLFEAVFERQEARLAQRVAGTAAQETDPWEVAYAGIRAFLDESQDPAVQRIILADGPSVLGWDRVRAIEAEYGLALIKAVIGRLAEEGAIGDHDPDALAHLWFGAVTEGALLIARADDPKEARRTVERELRRLIDGLAA